MNFRLLYILFIGTILYSCGVSLPEDVGIEYARLPQELDFNLHVKPILSDKCFACHGPDMAKQQAGLRLDLAQSAYGELANSRGKKALVPGNLAKSEVFHRIVSDDPEILMPLPKSNLKLTAYEKAVLIKWIEDGAQYKPHWAFVKPEKKKPPKVQDQKWARNPIDNFVLKKLEIQNLSPSPEAEKELLLRRVALDLTGLPPSLKEIKAFLRDSSENAYEKQVDRLLLSPHYGEKMAMDWMDLARFADTYGYSQDNYRDVSPWRDWVIRAFNNNLPYDQFILWQLAGDLLENPSKEQIIATAFNRMHPQNMEGGIVPEEFRVEYVLDRVNTMGKAFMALSLECARCHDHKYDPISQKGYYEMSAIFNNINEAGQISSDTPVPTMLLSTDQQDEMLDFLRSDILAKERQMGSIAAEEQDSFNEWLIDEKYKEIGKEKYPQGLVAHFEFETPDLGNSIKPAQNGSMKGVGSENETPKFANGKNNLGLFLNGDAWFDAAGTGSFRKAQPFSVGININIPEGLKDGVIFHKGYGAALSCFKGYHIALDQNRLELLMAHTSPNNAIIEYTTREVPKNVWLNLMLTYDGSGKASGLKIYQNGVELGTEVKIDNLYKDIHFNREKEFGVQVGGRMRGKGIGGAIVDDLMVFEGELSPLEVVQVANEKRFASIISKKRVELSKEEIGLLRSFFLFNISNPYKEASKDIGQARMVYADSVEAIPEIMVMEEMEERRKAYLLERGAYDAHGEEVFPNVLENILPMAADMPKNRKGLAQWLVHKDHPLTARVAVNRYWQNYFGRGIVRTTEDFGNQGELPSHPGLLDWLAVEFMGSGWDVKALQKLIVMSATYQQSSKMTKKSLEVDPENILLARGPTVRLSAEMLRDNALVASGLLNPKIGGKSVKPYQPEGLWKVNSNSYGQDTGDKLYRRSMYTIWKRSVPHPTLATFDAPGRSECTVRRQKTNTPLQALVLLNDPTYVETSRAIGEKMAKANSAQKAIAEVFMELTGRRPNNDELDILLELQEKQYTGFEQSEGKAAGWLNMGEYKPDKKLDANLVAANAVVASAIMNSDAAITKR